MSKFFINKHEFEIGTFLTIIEEYSKHFEPETVVHNVGELVSTLFLGVPHEDISFDISPRGKYNIYVDDYNFIPEGVRNNNRELSLDFDKQLLFSTTITKGTMLSQNTSYAYIVYVIKHYFPWFRIKLSNSRLYFSSFYPINTLYLKLYPDEIRDYFTGLKRRQT